MKQDEMVSYRVGVGGGNIKKKMDSTPKKQQHKNKNKKVSTKTTSKKH